MPEVEIAGSDGVVEARVLDAGSALLIIAINHGEDGRRVSLVLSPALAAGSWVDLESGAALALDGRTLSWAADGRAVLVAVRR